MPVLLREYSELKLEKEALNEMVSKRASGEPFIVKGVIQRADAKNQNGRIYPYSILKKECDRYEEDFVKRGNAIGCLDHVETPVIELKHASHVVTKIWWEDKEVHAEIKLLNTPAGKIAQEIVLSGIPLGISSRAVGTVSKNEAQGADIVGEDLQLVCFDLVGVPSTHNAFLSINEAIEVKNFDRNKILPAEMRVKTILQDILKRGDK